MTQTRPPSAPSTRSAVVRYQVSDVDKAIGFYTQRLGFQLEQQAGSHPMPDGSRQEPGGWNRIVIYVDDLGARIDALRGAGVRLRNQVESGPGGTQILLEDPDGNPIELHESPARPPG
jgi:glyoxylase I family protein